MKRLMLLTVLALVLALPAAAAEPADVNAEASEAPAAADPAGVTEEAVIEPATGSESLAQILGEFDLASYLTREQDPDSLCIVCPLDYCRWRGVRCSYTGCPRETCCNYTCYRDASCTQGNPNCKYWDCACKLRIQPL